MEALSQLPITLRSLVGHAIHVSDVPTADDIDTVKQYKILLFFVEVIVLF